jgi:hypothetical protein
MLARLVPGGVELKCQRRISSKQPVERMLASVEQEKLKEAFSDGQESPLPAARVLAAGLANRNPSYSKAMEVAAQSEMPTLIVW